MTRLLQSYLGGGTRLSLLHTAPAGLAFALERAGARRAIRRVGGAA